MLFKSKKNTRNTSDNVNKIDINMDNVLYQIGKDINDVKITLLNYKVDIEKRLDMLENRVKKLEHEKR